MEKRSTVIDLKSAGGKTIFTGLWAQADVFSQGLPSAIAGNFGLFTRGCGGIGPGIVCVSLSAYGHAGPWTKRRGFDPLVQCATGFDHAEGQAAGIEGPKELPMQILDHATGYLMAFGFRELSAVRHAAQLPATPARWQRLAMLIGTGKPVWVG